VRRLLRIALALGVLLAVAGCAASGDRDSDDSQHSGFYCGFLGGGHP